MNLEESTMLAIQNKLVEKLDFTINNKWIPYDNKDRDKIDNYVKQIAETNKPIIYEYIAGYDNWSAITKTKELSLYGARELFLTSGQEYFVTELDDCVKIQRIENRY